MAWTEIANLTGPPGTTDHGTLTGLTDDDHSQYHTDARGDARYQPLDSDLTTIAALSPSNDTVIQRKSGLWVARSMAQIKTDLVLAKADVGLGSVDNTSDAGKPVSTATQTALDAKVTATTARHAGITIGGASSVNTASTSYVTLGSSDLSTTLTYPPSGRFSVWIRASISCSNTALNMFGLMSFEIRDTNSSGTQRLAAGDDWAIFGQSVTANEGLGTAASFATLTGFPTTGTMYVRAMYRSVDSGNTATYAYRSLLVVPSP